MTDTSASGWQTATEEETRALGRALAAQLAPEGLLLLSGELGTGKTVLVQGLAEGLGIAPNEIQSPTYTLVREHEGAGGRLYHLDLYRLDPQEVEEMGLEEVLAAPAVKAVEWAERLGPLLGLVPPETITLRLVRRPDGGRSIERVEGPAVLAAGA